MPGVLLLVLLTGGFAFVFLSGKRAIQTCQGIWLPYPTRRIGSVRLASFSASNPLGNSWSLAIEKAILPDLAYSALSRSEAQVRTPLDYLRIGSCHFHHSLASENACAARRKHLASILRLRHSSRFDSDWLHPRPISFVVLIAAR